MEIIERFIPIVVLIMVLAGCAPIPIEKIVYPALEGRLLEGDTPLANYVVHFSYSKEDASKEKGGELYQTTKTDANGEFRIIEKRKWSLFRMAVPADFYAHYNLCFVSPSGEKRWFFASDIRTPDWAASSNLECYNAHLHKQPVGLKDGLYFEKNGCRVETKNEAP